MIISDGLLIGVNCVYEMIISEMSTNEASPNNQQTSTLQMDWILGIFLYLC